MSKVTVGQFLNAGFEFVVGDVVEDEVFRLIEITQPLSWNIPSCHNSDWFIESLPPRPNTGTQPVADGCVVEVVYDDGCYDIKEAKDMYWGLDKLVPHAVNIKTWKPSLKHLEQQMEKPVIKTNLTRDEFNAVKALTIIKWNVGDKCYTGDRIAKCTFMGAMADGVNCVLKGYDDCMLIVPMAELERVVDKERESAIDELEAIYNNHKGGFRDFFGAIYDAGYRK